MRPVMGPVMFAVMFAETLVADPYGLRTISVEGVPPGGGVSILSDGLFYLLALHRVWRLSEGMICQ
jgi:hypothetical protein